jgi:FkbM family methyltransferase
VSFTSFAQNFEDVVLWRALNDVTPGRYLDIGAQDPVIDSVSYSFYKAGWRGIHVEPTPLYAALLRESRPDEIVIEAAVTDASGPIEFYEIPETGLSTGKVDIANHHNECGYSQRKIVIPCVRLDGLLNMVDGDFHWMKVDVEGMEADVLRSWAQADARPWILVVESTFPNSQTPSEHEWIHEVLKRDYQEVLFDGLSRYYLHDSQRDRRALFQASANIFDNFVVTRDHFTARAIRTEVDDAELRLKEQQELASDRASSIGNLEIQIGELRRQLNALGTSLTLARKSEAAALSRIAESERQHQTAIRRLQLEHDIVRAELRTGFIQKNVVFRRQAREWRRAEANAREELSRHVDLAAELRNRLVQSEAQFEERGMELGRLGRELEFVRATAVRADALIRSAVGGKPSRMRALARMFGLVRPSSEWDALQRWTLPVFAEGDETPQQKAHERPVDNPMPNVHENRVDPYLRANSLARLLSWDDVDFVRCAYVTVLGRQPDVVGEDYYLNRIREGYSKLELIWQLRSSQEGKGHDPGIAGLDRALRRAAWERKLWIGAVIRFFTHGEPEDRLARMRRALTNELRVIRGELAAISQNNQSNFDQRQKNSNREFVPERPTDDQPGLSPTAAKVLKIMVGSKA